MDSDESEQKKRNLHPEEAFNKRRDVRKHHFVLFTSFSEFENRTFREKKKDKNVI